MTRSTLTLSVVSVMAALAVVSWGAAPVSAAEHATQGGVRLRRFALLIGVNDGGPSRAKLRYATSDARSMARVLENLGGVGSGDLVFVEKPTRAATIDGFARIEALLRAGHTPGVRRELLVYYSGHSDEEGLLLGNERVSYDELRARIKEVPAELRVAILDSCASGAFTRGKGGVMRPPFMLDASTDMRGHAFLTSSAANEVAQESDRISASFFTHFLVSGLRGAADANQDRRVTLQEAYQFASAETLARTERTRGGPQHAAYEFDLAGTGDMVVTDVRTTQASLVLTPELSGRITVREAGGALVAELRKPAGNTIELGVEAGAYVISMEGAPGARTTFEAKATLAQGQRAELAKLAFHPGRPVELAMARGDEAAPEGITVVEPPHRQVGSHLGIIPQAGDELLDVNGFNFGFVGARVARLDGFQLALAWTETEQRMHGLQMALGATLADGDTKGVQMTEGLAYASGRFRGLQMAGIAAVTRGDARGLQMAGIASFSDGWLGGVQMAGIVTGARHGKGLQMAGVVNAAEDMKGLQLAGVVNVVRDMKGLQIAGVTNVTRTMRGMQLSVVNVTDEGAGFSLGVVNVARKFSGFQFGVVNVAKEGDGEAFGLINIIGNGIHDVAAYSSDVMLTNLGFKFGGRHLYTEIGAGYTPGDDLAVGSRAYQRGTARWGSSFGLGWRFPLERGVLKHLELQAHSTSLYPVWDVTGTPPMVNALRLQAGVRVAPYVNVLAGLSYNVAIGQDGTDANLSLTGLENVVHSGATTVRMYPGFILGLQI
jgi:hypothetical protein